MADPSAIPLSSDPSALDLATQLAPLEQRRAMLAAMLQNSVTPQGTQMLGPIAVRQPILGVLAKALTGGIASSGMSNVTGQERGLVQQRMANASSAMDALMNASQPQGGTPTTLAEEPGPPDANGVGSYSVAPGTPPTMDAQGFGRAYQQARFAGVDPNILNASLGQFQLGRLLMQMGYGNMVPGMPQGGAPTVTPGNAYHGASVSMPTGAPAASQGAGAGAEGGFGGVPPQAVAMLMAGAYNPAFAKLGQGIIDYNKPMDVRQNGVVFRNGQPVFAAPGQNGQIVFDQNGNPTFRQIPGQIPAAAAAAGATEAAKAGAAAPYKVQMFTMQDGRQVPGYTDGTGRIILMQPGAPGTQPGATSPPAGSAPSAPATQGAPANYGFPASAGDVPSPYPAPGGQAAILQNEYRSVSAQPDSPQRTQNLAALTVEMQRAGVAPNAGAAMPSGAQVPPPANGATAPAFGQPAGAQAEAEAQGKTLAAQAQQVDTDARNAQQAQARVTEMRNLLDHIQSPGMFAPGRLIAGRALEAVGAPDSVANTVAGGDIGAMIGLSKQTINMAFDTTKQLSVRPAAAEVILAAKNTPNLEMTKPAIESMLDYTQGVTNWQMDRQRLKQAWIAPPSEGGHGTYTGFEDWFNRTHPIDSYVPSAAQISAALKGGAPQLAAGGPAPGSQSNPPAQTKTLNGVTYVKQGGKWYQQ